jgi:phosphoglycerate dehydrogenase-like enzyme
VLLLLSETAYRHFADRLGAATPEVRFVRMQRDGTLLFGDVPVPWDDIRPDIAWLTADLFDNGPVRPFLKLSLNVPVSWLHSAGAGTDHPVFGRLLERGVRLTTSHVTGIPIAEYVMRAVLDHYQRPARWAVARAGRRWEPGDFREIHGTTWLVVGLGTIGNAVSVRARSFGARVVGVRRHPTGDEPVDECIRPDRLRTAVGSAEVVVLCAPGGPETRHMVGADVLSAMASGSVLVNVGRGSLIDEAALRHALDAGVPEVAVLDVCDEEPPPPESWLWDHPRVVLTPHTSAGGTGRYQRAAEVFGANLVRWSAGQPLLDEIVS